MEPGGILALDLSSIVGHAYGPATAGRVAPICGAWVLPKHGGLGAKMAAFENELIAAIAVHEPRCIVMEAPLPPTGQASTLVAMQQFGLAAMTESAAYRASVQVFQVASSTVRKAIMGTGRFKEGTAKQEVLQFCRNQGWPVPDHNAADACLVWRYASLKFAAGSPL